MNKTEELMNAEQLAWENYRAAKMIWEDLVSDFDASTVTVARALNLLRGSERAYAEASLALTKHFNTSA